VLRHEMSRADRAGDATLFVCGVDGCGRMLELRRGTLTVLTKGDPNALHGSGVGLQLAVRQD
jgi:hypothetical protein